MIPFNEEAVENFRIQYDLDTDKKIALDSYFANMGGGGVCRHQALLAGYLTEKLIEESGMDGGISVDRSTIRDKGVHAWVRYEDASGKVFIIDPTQGYVGTKKDSKGEYWNYKRPD